MLRVRSLELEDFGPYRGQQSIDFSGQDGVIVVYGDNMRGKTTLLNGIRFALFGKILGRGEREIETHKLLNLQALREGKKEFKVSLRLEQDDRLYDIVRTCEIPEDKNGRSKISTLLFIDGEPQNQDATKEILTRLLPEQVSRFFLFDGELLQQYEELLLDESETARGIREAIESILGLPVLVNGREDLSAILDDARRAETRAAKRNKATEVLANQLEILNGKLRSAKGEEKTIVKDLGELNKEREETEDLLRRSSKIEALLTRRDSLKKDITDLEGQEAEKAQSLSEMLDYSWHWPLVAGLNQRKNSLTSELISLRDKKRTMDRSSHLLELRKIAADTNTCPVCKNDINSKHMKVDANEGKQGEDSELEIREDTVLQQIAILNQLTLDSRGPAAVEVSRQLQQVRMSLQIKRNDKDDVMTQLLTGSADEVESARQTLGKLIAAIQKHKTTLGTVRGNIKDYEGAIATAQQKMRAAGGDTLSVESRRREIVEGLRDAFAVAVDRYRDELRMKVEKDASDLFLKLTTEPEYEKLVINHNYGLQIRHIDDYEIEIRSSGAEHIVALSLVGALQANAPLRGPLFIDSPFGRLDENHVENVVQALPEMAKQVVLLVYKKEMSEKVARENLKTHLLSEYELNRISAVHTEISQMGGPTK